MVLITIVTGAYKPTYNWWASHCKRSSRSSLTWTPRAPNFAEERLDAWCQRKPSDSWNSLRKRPWSTVTWLGLWMKYGSSYPHIWYDRYVYYIYIFIYSIFNGVVWGKINRKPLCFATKQLVILNIVPWKILAGDHSPFMHQSPCENPWVQELVGTKGHRPRCPSYCPTLKRHTGTRPR